MVTSLDLIPNVPAEKKALLTDPTKDSKALLQTVLDEMATHDMEQGQMKKSAAPAADQAAAPAAPAAGYARR